MNSFSFIRINIDSRFEALYWQPHKCHVTFGVAVEMLRIKIDRFEYDESQN